jgi:hypothetical protein
MKKKKKKKKKKKEKKKKKKKKKGKKRSLFLFFFFFSFFLPFLFFFGMLARACLASFLLSLSVRAQVLLPNHVTTPQTELESRPTVDEASTFRQLTILDRLGAKDMPLAQIHGPWDEPMPLAESRCDVDGEARDMSVIRLIWAEKEMVSILDTSVYRFREGEIIEAPTVMSPCKYVRFFCFFFLFFFPPLPLLA